MQTKKHGRTKFSDAHLPDGKYSIKILPPPLQSFGRTKALPYTQERW